MRVVDRFSVSSITMRAKINWDISTCIKKQVNIRDLREERHM